MHKIRFNEFSLLYVSSKNTFNTSMYSKYPVYKDEIIYMEKDIENSVFYKSIKNTRTTFPEYIIYEIPIKYPYISVDI